MLLVTAFIWICQVSHVYLSQRIQVTHFPHHYPLENIYNPQKRNKWPSVTNTITVTMWSSRVVLDAAFLNSRAWGHASRPTCCTHLLTVQHWWSFRTWTKTVESSIGHSLVGEAVCPRINREVNIFHRVWSKFGHFLVDLDTVSGGSLLPVFQRFYLQPATVLTRQETSGWWLVLSCTLESGSGFSLTNTKLYSPNTQRACSSDLVSKNTGTSLSHRKNLRAAPPPTSLAVSLEGPKRQSKRVKKPCPWCQVPQAVLLGDLGHVIFPSTSISLQSVPALINIL